MELQRCKDCKHCFPKATGKGYVCAGHNYGNDITRTVQRKKDCWSIGLGLWTELCELWEKHDKAGYDKWVRDIHSDNSEKELLAAVARIEANS